MLGNQYWSVLQAGAEKAGEDLGCNVVVVGTALESDIEGQLTLLQNAVSAQADGIVIAPLDSVSLDAPITEAYNSGTPVVLVDTVTTSDNYSAALMTNNVEAGKTAAEEMLRRLKSAASARTRKPRSPSRSAPPARRPSPTASTALPSTGRPTPPRPGPS